MSRWLVDLLTGLLAFLPLKRNAGAGRIEHRCEGGTLATQSREQAEAAVFFAPQCVWRAAFLWHVHQGLGNDRGTQLGKMETKFLSESAARWPPTVPLLSGANEPFKSE